MERKPNDSLIGCIVMALVMGLSVLAGGVKILIYGGWCVVCGLLIFFLLNLKRVGSTTLAIVLMPTILLRYFLPKKFRRQLEQVKTEEKKTASRL
ncbi:hypothetical protein ACL9RI_12250 [Janthinobacterium sp. Mn2066]|uniref:hypothetical protein n=1 Tax=Janthinobacterium sp. Mn2066 TaxID=3395264 RepID=UPI003BDE4B12